MRTWILKETVISQIKTDPVLFGKVAKAINVAPTTMPRLLTSKSAKLTQITALDVIGKHLKKGQRELIEATELQPAA